MAALGRARGWAGGRAAQQVGGPSAPPPPPPRVFFLCSFDPSLVSLSAGSAVPAPPSPQPQPPGDKLSLLYLQSLRGLSIYYYGLIIMIIASVDPPPVRLSLLGFPGDPGCGGCTGSHLLAPPPKPPPRAVRETAVWGHWLGPETLEGGPTALPPPSLPFLGVASSWLWGAW